MPRKNTIQVRVALDNQVEESVRKFAENDERTFSNAVQYLVKKGLAATETSNIQHEQVAAQ